jgi:hypothetical protein
MYERKNMTGEELQTSRDRMSRLGELQSLPHRNIVLHWAAFVLSAVSLVMLSTWVFGTRGTVPTALILVDIGLSITFAVEFFTRSGFHWHRTKYLRTHFFDFIAIVPALALVNHGFIIQEVWVWVVLVARAIRMIDRALGDGFVQRNAFALVEGFEEEITDRVLDNIIARIEVDTQQAGFSHGLAETLRRNKPTLLHRIREETPHEGLLPDIAHIVGLDAALERFEEKTYDAIVKTIDSEEVDRAVRDVIKSAFSRMRNELGKKSWRKHLGIKRRQSE